MSRNVASESKITAKQEQLIAALIAGNTHTVAAAALCVDRKTVERWLKLPHVQEALRDAQKQVFDESLSTLMLYTDESIGTLRTLMKDESVPPAVRIRSAQILLERAIEHYKTNELEQKIEALEQLIKQTGK